MGSVGAPAERTPDAPTHQGRVLPEQDEELVDRGSAFDVTTLLSRRRIVQVLGLGAATLGLAACAPKSGSTSSGSTASTGASGTTTTSDGEIPEETAGRARRHVVSGRGPRLEGRWAAAGCEDDTALVRGLVLLRVVLVLGGATTRR